MTKCNFCEREMTTAKGCVEHVYLLRDGKQVEPIKVGVEGWIEPNERCTDCGAKYGEYHHIGCDVERCGVCGGQLITCECEYDDKMIVYTE